MTIQTTLSYIAREAGAADLEAIINAVNTRRKILGSMRAAQVTTGATIRLCGLSPKYLNGREGKITGAFGGRVTVTLDAPIYARGRFFNQTVIPGVPASCCEVLS